MTERLREGINPDEEFVTVEIIDPAKVPDGAVQPQPPLIIAASIIVGLGAAILLALAVDRLRRRIETSDDLAEVTNLPLLAQIPRNRALARGETPKLVWDDPGMFDMQETFRSLRTNLAFVAEGKPPAILVTSAGVGAGKTTTVANVGVAFAQMGVKTAIVDADLRRPAQHQVFGVDSPPVGAEPGARRSGQRARDAIPQPLRPPGRSARRRIRRAFCTSRSAACSTRCGIPSRSSSSTRRPSCR